MHIPFSKYEGTQNSFVVVSRSDLPQSLDCHSLARLAANPSVGIGSDGLMVVGELADPTVVDMYNPDGSAMGMCGNGIRCVYRFLVDRLSGGLTEFSSINFLVEGRLIACSSADKGQTVSVNMGKPAFLPPEIPYITSEGDNLLHSLVVNTRQGVETFNVSVVSMGNPHCVILGDSSLQARVAELGPLIENHSAFPKRTNVEFVTIEDPSRVKVAVWERGAGVTRACGTGACAVVVSLRRLGLVKPQVDVELPGGIVRVTWDADSDDAFLDGPTRWIASGVLEGAFGIAF